MAFSTPLELQQAYDARRLHWLRKRFLLYAGVMIGFNVLGILTYALFLLLAAFVDYSEDLGAYGISEQDSEVLASQVMWAGQLCAGAVAAAAYTWAFQYVRRHEPDRQTAIRLIYWLFVATHFVPVIIMTVTSPWMGDGMLSALLSSQAAGSLAVSHLIIALFIPWTVREAIQPLIPVMALHLVLTLAFSSYPIFGMIGLALAGMPGIAVCAFKQWRFRRSFDYHAFRDAYAHMSREVEQARTLHESFFPETISEGPVRMDYAYQPMSQLGGDYLHAHVHRNAEGQPRWLICSVIDVTGHGLAATLTANHLHALLRRATLREQEKPDPAQLLAGLNRYMHESFSGLSVYATAICLLIDVERDELCWASAGHPPALLTTGDGIEKLSSTTYMLGVVEEEVFGTCAKTVAFKPGQCVFAYTDGITEATLKSGKMIGIDGFTSLVQKAHAASAATCNAMLESIDRDRRGVSQDDILLACISRHPAVPPPGQDTVDQAQSVGA